MIQNYFDNVKRFLGSLISNARAREGWGKGIYLFSFLKIIGAPAKQAERKARAGREFLFPEPLFLPAPPERKISEFSVRIFAEKNSDFVQKTQPICKVLVSRLARGFAPRFGGRIFKQFPNEPIIFRPKGESKAAIFCPKAITN